MKITKNIYLGLGVLASMALASCQADMDTPELDNPVPASVPNTTIAELKAAMWQDATNYATELGYKDEATKTPYIIKGRVISSDATGNIYKSMYIQDETAAITLSVNQSSLYNFYPLGQEVVLNLSPQDFMYPDYENGGELEKSARFCIGKYAGLEQIGGLGIYNGSYQVSFMPFELLRHGMELSGNPDLDVHYIPFGQPYPTDGKMYCIRATIADINGCTSTEDIQKMQSQFVELQNVHFEDGGKAPYAPYEESVSRNLLDASGNTIIVRNSGYASFYHQMLPEGTGNVRGLLSYFKGSWQLILRSAADCIFDSKGTQSEPYSVEEAIELANTGANGWVEGFIAGTLRPGVQTVSSNEDIDWTASDPTDNNLVIAPEAGVRDYTRCLLLPLAQGSVLREKGNLADNPSNLGKKVKAIGSFVSMDGMVGLSGNNGSASEFEIDGVSTGGGGTTPTGSTLYSGLSETASTIDWTFDNVEMPSGLSYIWNWKLYNEKYYLNASAYSSNTAYSSLSWAISPVIDLTNVKSASVVFEHAAKFQTTLTQLCGFGVRVEGSTSWTELTIPTWPTAGSWTFASSGNIDLSGFAGKKIQLGLKYGSSTAGADTWEIKNLVVTGVKN